MPSAPSPIIPPPSGDAPSAPESVVDLPSGSAPNAPGGVASAPGSSPNAPGVIVEAYTPPQDIPATPNFLETNDTAEANNDLRFTQVNPLIPTYVELVIGPDLQPSSVSVTGGNTVFIRANTNFGVSNLTAAAAKTLIEASAAASALVTCAFKAGNNGTGRLRTAFGPTLLSGGTPAIPAVTPPSSIIAAPEDTSPTAPGTIV